MSPAGTGTGDRCRSIIRSFKFTRARVRVKSIYSSRSLITASTCTDYVGFSQTNDDTVVTPSPRPGLSLIGVK